MTILTVMLALRTSEIMSTEAPVGGLATGSCIARIKRPDKRKDTSTDQVVMRRWDSAKS
jgi:hypothetical protein